MTPLLEARDVHHHYATRQGRVAALRGVDLTLQRGEWLGVVGESGSGKSTLGRVLCGLEHPSAGTVQWNGASLGDSVAQRQARARLIQPVFQDSNAALNPRRTVGETMREALALTGGSEAQVPQLLQQVGLEPAVAGVYPHTLSGGQRQRVGLARALCARPSALVLDEPVSSLDVSVAAQVLNLLLDLRSSLQLAAVFIAHDLPTVRRVCQRVAVMYLGRVVEEGPVELLDAPHHPYTQALARAVPHPGAPPAAPPPGESPSPLHPPGGCAFHPRCAQVLPQCPQQDPARQTRGPLHQVACHLPPPPR